MTVALAILAAVLFVALALGLFIRSDPAKVASGLRGAGPPVIAILGALLIVIGRAALGGLAISAALAWYAAGRRRPAPVRSPGKRSTVRTAALEMELDHDTGGLDGLVLAGSHEGKVLARLGLAELKQLYRELMSDSESRQLLETYLDGRFPIWRDDAKADAGGRKGVPPGSGAMTKEEAYKVLGLETGATPADVRQAHRRLMQRLHPDLGGTSFLAARINEAKDVLLSDHG